MKTIIIENTHMKRDFIDFGWGNGYVLIPSGHPLHGKHYDDIDVDVHGGLTYSELITEEMVKTWKLDVEDLGKWCVGFDTFHSGDSLSRWSEGRVQEETNRLMDQLKSI